MISNQAIAQEKSTAKLHGKVVDNSSDEVLPGVEVTIQDSETKATTNEKGKYSFESLKAGTYTVTVKAEGYQDWEKEVVVTTEAKELTIKLKPTAS